MAPDTFNPGTWEANESSLVYRASSREPRLCRATERERERENKKHTKHKRMLTGVAVDITVYQKLLIGKGLFQHTIPDDSLTEGSQGRNSMPSHRVTFV